MKKPIIKYSNSNKWKMYIVSIFLQLWAHIITLFTGREITHGFYYSRDQKELIKQTEKYSNNFVMNRSIISFRGKEYTEMRRLEYGWCNWKDSKLIGFGSINDVELNKCNLK